MRESDFIQKLYRELHIEEQVFPEGSAYRKPSREAEELFSKLLCALPEEEARLLNAYCDAASAQAAAYDEAVFRLGFRYGALFMREILE